MSKGQREKGKRGEREVVGIIKDILGLDAKRRVRQHDGDSDVMGVPGWSIEVKNCADLRVKEWWRQTVDQAGDDLPVLFFKVPRRGWRCIWPLNAIVTQVTGPTMWYDPTLTCESSPDAWAVVVRESGRLWG